VIGRNPDVGCTFFDHTEQRGKHAANRGDFLTIVIARRGQRVVVSEQFVGAVDQMYTQIDTPGGVGCTLSLTACLKNGDPISCGGSCPDRHFVYTYAHERRIED